MTLDCTPHFSLVSSSHMKLRCEYNHLYLLFTITNTYFRYNSRSAVDWLQEVISPGISNSTMSAFSTNNSDSMTLIVPKLCDDGDKPGSMLICHPFLLFWHCLLSLTAPLQLPYNVTYHVTHATQCDVLASAHTQHYYRHLIILVIGFRYSTQAPHFTAPFMPYMTLLGFMCPGLSKLTRSQTLSHHAINKPHDMLPLSHSPSPDQLPLLCTPLVLLLIMQSMVFMLQHSHLP